MAASSTRLSRYSSVIHEEKLFFQAVNDNENALVPRMITSGVSVNCESYYGSKLKFSENTWTPLHTAASCGNGELVEKLIFAGADFLAKDHFDVTPLHLAAEKGYLKILKLLVKSGADCNAATIRRPIPSSVDWGVSYPVGTTPLHLAAKENRVECVEELIRSGADYNFVDEVGRTSLYLAAAKGLEECVLVHLKMAAGAGRNILSLPSLSSSSTALHHCVDYRMKACIKALLECGSSANHTNNLGNTPLHQSVHYKPQKIQKHLPRPRTDKIRYLALQNLIPYGQPVAILKLLVLNGYDSDVNITDRAGFSCLHYVCFDDMQLYMRRRPESAIFLLAYGAQPNIADKFGFSLLESELRRVEDGIILKMLVKVLPVLPILNFDLYELNSGRSRWMVWNPERVVLRDWYRNKSTNPRRLQHFCRYSIRQAMGCRRLKLVWKLPIPGKLQDYLLLNYHKTK